MKKVPFLRASYFIWPVLPLALAAFIGTQGLPHVIWSYEWQPTGANSHADFSRRFYTRCTYASWRGTVTDYPVDGRCGWFRFAHDAEARP